MATLGFNVDVLCSGATVENGTPCPVWLGYYHNQKLIRLIPELSLIHCYYSCTEPFRYVWAKCLDPLRSQSGWVMDVWPFNAELETILYLFSKETVRCNRALHARDGSKLKSLRPGHVCGN